MHDDLNKKDVHGCRGDAKCRQPECQLKILYWDLYRAHKGNFLQSTCEPRTKGGTIVYRQDDKAYILYISPPPPPPPLAILPGYMAKF